jgi:hypothetical protein
MRFIEREGGPAQGSTGLRGRDAGIDHVDERVLRVVREALLEPLDELHALLGGEGERGLEDVLCGHREQGSILARQEMS